MVVVQSEYVVANQRHKTRDKRFLHHQESSPGKLKVFAMTSQGERAAMRATALKAPKRTPRRMPGARQGALPSKAGMCFRFRGLMLATPRSIKDSTAFVDAMESLCYLLVDASGNSHP